MDAIGALLLVIIVPGLYFLPTLLAAMKDSLATNILMGQPLP